MNKKILIYIGITIVGIFALIGVLFVAVFIAMQFGLLNVRGSIDARNQFFLDASKANATSTPPCDVREEKTCEWNKTPEWNVVSAGLRKDAEIIARVAKETGVSSRMIAAVVIPEQIRFFTSEREIFKRYFEPLKILGSLSQFSLGVSGIKSDTARSIEIYANDEKSRFYPDEDFSSLIAYAPEADREKALYDRLTDEHNHYYSYLYTALYIREVAAHWKAAGYDVHETPEVVVTLFNIGFGGSRPKADPVAAGSPVTTGGRVYAFGQLGADFYHSSELLDIFPR